MKLQFDKQVVTERIASVLNDIDEKVEFNDILVSADDLSGILQDKFSAMVNLDEMDTNGWEMDYWISVEYENKKYYIDGSGYYRTLSFHKDED